MRIWTSVSIDCLAWRNSRSRPPHLIRARRLKKAYPRAAMTSPVQVTPMLFPETWMLAWSRTGQFAPGSAGTSAALLLFLQVLQPPPGHLALAAALIGHRDLPGQLEISTRQQPVGEQEFR
jgi:hypothetical protein